MKDPAYSHTAHTDTKSPERYALEVVTTESRFDSIEKEWSELLDRSNSTPFQSFEWLRTWWKHFGETDDRKQLHIVAIRTGGRIVAIAPFYIKAVRRLHFVRLRKLSFIGHETTDYLDILVENGCRTDCIGIIARHLSAQSSHVDVFHLIDMPDRTCNHELLYNELIALGLRGEQFANEYCPRMQLQQSWNDTIAQAQLTSNKRSVLKKIQRKVESDFHSEFQVVSDTHVHPGDFDEFIQLHQRRWNESGQVGVFAGKGIAEFHHDIAEAFFQRKWYFLAFLVLDGRRVAANYGFVYKNEFFHYLSGVQLQGEYAKYSLGRALHLFSMIEVIKRGMRLYDFMRGTERYKYDFGSADAENWTILVYSRKRVFCERRFKIVLLADSVKRRCERELYLLKHTHKRQGKRTLIPFLFGRVWMNLRDGVHKVGAPEKQLTNHD